MLNTCAPCPYNYTFTIYAQTKSWTCISWRRQLIQFNSVNIKQSLLTNKIVSA